MKIDTVIPSFHSPQLTEMCIQSIERFKPDGWDIRNIVVENSDDTSYKSRISSLGNVLWVQNPTKTTEATANADGVMAGVAVATAPWVLILHCDTCVTSEKFFDNIKSKVDEGYRLIGTQRYPNAIDENCYHCSGLFAETSVAKLIDYSSKRIDACEDLTFYCRDNKIKRTCYLNTLNMPELANNLSARWRHFHVDRCVDENNNVIFVHLGRGIPKTKGTYNKPNRVYLSEWLAYCRGLIGCKNM